MKTRRSLTPVLGCAAAALALWAGATGWAQDTPSAKEPAGKAKPAESIATTELSDDGTVVAGRPGQGPSDPWASAPGMPGGGGGMSGGIGGGMSGGIGGGMGGAMGGGMGHGMGGGGMGARFPSPWRFGDNLAGQGAVSVTAFGNADQKVVDQIAEDLRILSYLLSRNLERAFAGNSPDYKLGIPMLVTAGGHSVEASYLEGFGVVLRIRVGFPLAPSPGAAGGPGAVQGVSEWDEARRALAGAEAPEGAIAGGDWEANLGYTSGEPQRYDPKLVEAFKKRTLALLKNASNLRHIKPEEWIVVSITGQPGVGRQARFLSRSVSRQEQRRVTAHVKDARASDPKAPGDDTTDEPKTTGKAPEAATLVINDVTDLARATMMTIRVKKTNADAFAAGKISEEQFAKEAQMGSYFGPTPDGAIQEGSDYRVRMR